ncbi:helix-turn-helix domain-containing protein [Proteus myxofaciens]|uniref:helix-turn-helix domain-containing protein n=1 Tax=Proteus myxofaciens TaxID=184072 RepID=UPI00083234D9|nr:helix-turn-helix transcriptional regulator [Proteus myxofaciens]
MNDNRCQYNQIIRKNTGLFIRKSRINKSLSGVQLGQLINLSQQQISRYESGSNSLNIETLNTIFKVLEIDWRDFVHKVLDVDISK